jgi:nucleotide-binding universal stress UspA family protein
LTLIEFEPHFERKEHAMLPIRIIVHPTDFSENSQAAFEMACAMARDFSASLYVVHVDPPSPVFAELGAIPPFPVNKEALERKLAEIQSANPAVKFTRLLVDGNEATEITAFAEKVHADLIVMGTHGRTGLGRLLMGSVAEEVLRRAPCPVMTIKNPVVLRCDEPATCELAETV